MLHDDVLLVIFDFYLEEDIYDFERYGRQTIEEWITLAHVCRRWRSVVFQSQRRLNLRLLCTPETPARNLDIWPPLPLVIHDSYQNGTSGVDNIIAVLEHNDRVCQIQVRYSLQLDYFTNSMRKPFPELKNLQLDGGLE